MSEYEDNSSKRKGTVKWFNASKGFGFITPDEGDQELFVHQSTIKVEGFRSLREGERVEFDLEIGEDGRDKAINVTGPDGTTPQGAPFIPRYAMHPYGFPPPPPPPPAVPGAFYPAHTRPEGHGNRHSGAGMSYPGYYCYYVPAPRYPGAWDEGYMQQAQQHQPQMLIRPPRAPSTPRPSNTSRPTQLIPGKSSGFQVVVHNLPWSCTWQQLKEVFNQWEVIRADVIVDEYGRSRGFGTVRFSSEDDAASAIDSINGTEIEGRKITVRLDRYA